MRHIPKAIVWLMLVAVVALFFCPLPYGSYQSTHGPTAPPGFLLGFLPLLLALLVIGLRMLVKLSLVDLGRTEASTNPAIDPPTQGKFQALLC